jgi:L-arabinokinase
VLVSFGGFGLEGLDALLPRLPGVRWVLAPHGPSLDRPDVERVEGVAYPDLVASADLVLSKPGYGILGEALTAGTRMLWLPRGPFPEAPFLVRALEAHGGHLVAPAELATAVPRALAQPAPPPVPAPAAAQLAEWVLSARFPGW